MEEIGAQMARAFTPEDAMAMMWNDHNDDQSVVRLGDNHEMYMGSVRETDEGFVLDVGDKKGYEPNYGLQHDYQQARVCLDWMKKFDKQAASVEWTVDEILNFDMVVPDIPPYAPKYVDKNDEEKKFEAPQLRADYKKIMVALQLCAPKPGIVVDDKVMSGISDPPQQMRDQPVFLGRTQAPLKNSVYMRFNPLSPAGAALIRHVKNQGTTLAGEYEVRGKMYPFVYETVNETAFHRYTVCPDEWVPRIGVSSFDLLAFDLVADYDFWRHGTREYDPRSVVGRAVPVRDRIVPAGYRFVDYTPERSCYHQRTSRDVVADGPRWIMHAGSSLVHRVEPHQMQEVEGEYVRLELADNAVMNPIAVTELVYDGEKTGILCRKVPKEVLEPEMWRGSAQLNYVYAEGVKNAIRFKIGEDISFVFRAKAFSSKVMPPHHDSSIRKHDMPLLGVYTNPGSSHVLLSGDYFKIAGTQWTYDCFTTHFMHRGVYSNMSGSVAARGVSLFDYAVATHTYGRARALIDIAGEEIWQGPTLASVVCDTIGTTTGVAAETELDRMYRAACKEYYGEGEEDEGGGTYLY